MYFESFWITGLSWAWAVSYRLVGPAWVVESTLCSCKLRTVRNAYGSLSFPSTLTVVPSSGWDRIRSVRAEISKRVESASKSCRRRVLMPWKSWAGWGSNISKSTFTMSRSSESEPESAPFISASSASLSSFRLPIVMA